MISLASVIVIKIVIIMLHTFGVDFGLEIHFVICCTQEG